MNIQRRLGTTGGMVMGLAMFTSMAVAAGAQQATVEGLVIGRSGPTMAVQTHDSPRVIVVLADTTKATEKGGFLGLSHKDLGITQLVPGLAVKVEGTYDQDHKLLAKKVEFSRSALKTARAIDAGLQPTNAQIAAQGDQLRSDRRDIENGQQQIAQNTADINTTKDGLAANVQATNANGQAIGRTNGRIGQLDEYETKGSLTVNFANGKATISKKEQDQLAEFVKSASGTPGYMIQVEGYASKTGSAAANQRLSSERANAVLTVIQQSGAVPLTRILAPAAMGTTNQVGDNRSRKGQAENRRVVVTILVNKGISNTNSNGL